jgi:hypothetical protein
MKKVVSLEKKYVFSCYAYTHSIVLIAAEVIGEQNKIGPSGATIYKLSGVHLR